MLDVIEQCFKDRLQTDDWMQKLKLMIPSYGVSLVKEADLCLKIRKETAAILNLS